LCIKISSALNDRQFNKIILESIAVSNGINKARMLGDTPSNICNPTFLAKEAKKLEKIHKSIKVEILDENKCDHLKWVRFYLSLREVSSQLN